MDLVSTIGNESRISIDAMVKLVNSQRQSEFPEVEALMGAASSALNRCHVRISVVGQVKAGKSTLINVLSGIRDLLPTEVNPWTAVITNLHFGHADKPHSGGEFQFFSADEWQKVLEGDKETRAMAEDLLPGFDVSVLQAQIEEMKAKAEKRLGSLYRHLLGKHHRFNNITAEILERYVSAGHPDKDGDMDETVNAGRFSGITKSAEVFLDAGPFAIPVTLSDTPGINDPFLVRDEITTSSFRDSGIFTVALSVHQALGAADMALIKMLSRHKGKALVVFVNRIDELEAPEADVPELLHSLRQKLDADLDGAPYTLLAGSAHWGYIAQHGSDDEVENAINTAGFAAYCAKTGVAESIPARERLWLASGVAHLGQVLSEKIAQGPVRAAISEITAEISATVAMHEKLLSERLEGDEVMLLDVGDIPAILEAEKNRLIARVNALADLADEFDNDEGETRSKLLENGQVVSQSIMHTIEATLSSFIDGQAADLGTAFSSGAAGNKWSLDTADLGQKIEKQTVLSFHKGREEMDLLIDRFGKNTDRKIGSVLGNIDISKLLENLPHDDIFPGFKPSTTLVDIELVNERGWKFWKKTEMTKEEAIARIQQVIRQEMLPAVNICSKVAEDAIAERTFEALSRISNIKQAARQLLVEEVGVLKSEIEALDQGVNKDTISRINANRAKRAKARHKRIKQLADFSAELENLVLARPNRPASAAKSRVGSQ